jgi:hypothetical protein
MLTFIKGKAQVRQHNQKLAEGAGYDKDGGRGN